MAGLTSSRVRELEETAEYHQREAAKQFGYVKELKAEIERRQAAITYACDQLGEVFLRPLPDIDADRVREAYSRLEPFTREKPA